MLGLGLILAACEDGTHPGMWRSPGSHAATAAYFAQLAAWGHALSEIEQQITDACELAETQQPEAPAGEDSSAPAEPATGAAA